MGSSDHRGYCSFTKAVEHLGDRWSLLILRELVQFGPQGFNALAVGVPGHISRSVLAERLRRLEDLGILGRHQPGARLEPYRLTPAGQAFVPTLLALRGWAEEWLPDDPAMVARDPDILSAWLAERLDLGRLPARQAVIAMTMLAEPEHRFWLVLEAGREPFGCLEDPLLDEGSYVHVEATIPVLTDLARGRLGFAGALAKGTVRAFGDPRLVRGLVSWFRPADALAQRRPALAS